MNGTIISFPLRCLKALSDLFYPPVCEVCGRTLVEGEKYVCTSCFADFPFVDDDFSNDRDVLDAFDESIRPENIHALFYYNKYSRYKNLIYRVKYGSNPELGVFLGRMLGNKMKGHCTIDGVVPVPLHPKRERKRGYNQAREIARGICDVLNVELLDDVIVRVRNNVSQTGKNLNERVENVSGIFALNKPEVLVGRHILLVDDVITTGATVHACIKVMAVVENVHFSLGCIGRTL